MDRDSNRRFIARAESLVKPQDLTAISFLGDFNKVLPKGMQERIMAGGAAKVPYMGFIVDPYCFFLAYGIKDPAAAAAMLPEGYELAEARVFKDQEPRPLALIGAFALRTSAFAGNRLELYLTARRKADGRLSWIIAGYETNTSSYDPKNCFSGHSADPALVTTTPYGELLAEFAGLGSGRAFSVSADLERGRWRELDPELWVDGNLSIDYGGELAVASAKPFSLIFDPYLMKKALELPPESLDIRRNSCLENLVDGKAPLCAAVFPYAQHFIIKQDLDVSEIPGEAELQETAMGFIAAKTIRAMAGDDIKKPLFRGLAVSAVLTWGLLAFLLVKVLAG